MPDLNPYAILDVIAHHLEVPAAFVPTSLLLGGAAWWLAPRRGWARVPAVLAGCGLALVLAVTLVRPLGQFPAGGLNPVTTLRYCMVGSLSLARLYEQLNLAMLLPFAVCATLATRRPLLVIASCVMVSAVVEFVQSATGGGQCQARDLVHNTAGSVVGVLLALVMLRLAARQRGITADLGAGPGSSR